MKNAYRVKSRIAVSFSVIYFLLACCAGLYAQNSRGTILGHVTDPSGGVIVGARVTVRNLSTEITNQFTTNSVGDYVFLNLVPGTYEITVGAPGFRTEHYSELVLEVDQTLRQDYQLRVGTATTEVEVTAHTQMVQTDNTTLGNVLEEALIEDLPLNGRDFTSLLELSAGAANLSGGSQAAWAGHGLNSTFAEVSLNGARPESTSFMVDGVTDTDTFFSGIANIPSEFAVQEVKVQTGLYSSEYGQGSGQVNVAVKSGTNSLHGKAYDFLQNDRLNPGNLLQEDKNIVNGTNTPLRTPFKQNQFGGTLGGPVKIPFLYNGRDKTFWFVAYDGGRRSTSTGPSQTAQIPTASERNGNFSDWPYPIYDPTTNGTAPIVPCDPNNPNTPCNPLGRQAFTNNQIPSARISAMGQKLLNLYPTPNAANCTQLPCQNYSIPLNDTLDTDNITMRVDQNWGEKDRLFFTGHIRREDSTTPSLMPYSGSMALTHSELYGLNWEHFFSAHTMNTARFAYNRQFWVTNSVTAYGPDIQAALGFQNAPSMPALHGIPVISLGDQYSNIGNGNNGYSTKHGSWQYIDNLKLIRGKHTITVGADIRRMQEFEQDTWMGIGGLSFNGGYTASNPADAGTIGPNAGNPVADMLLGDLIGLTPPAPLGVDYLHVVGTNWNFFAQDDFRLSPRLTLNLGLRYERPPNYHNTDNVSGWNFDPANGGSLSWVNKSFVQGVEQTAAAQGLTPYAPYLNCCISNTLVPIDNKDFAPRIGIAWRPFPTDRLVVRAGYGIFYDTYMRFYDLIQNFDINALQTEFPNTNYTAGTGYETASPEPPLNQLWLPPVSGAQFFSTSQPWNSSGFSSPILNQVDWPQNHNPYNQQWTLDTQYALTPSLLLDVGYVGSHGLREPTYWLFNTATPPKVAGDACNYLFDASQAAGTSCATDPNFQPIDTRVPYKNLPSIMYANANILGSNYNALQVQLRQRSTHGLTYLVSFTWSRSFDEMSGIGNVSGNGGFVQNPYNVKGDYGPASFDQPKRLTASGSYDLPVGKGKPLSLGRADWLFGGWKTSGIYTLTSGRTFTVYGYTGPWYDQMGSQPYAWPSYRANVSSSPTSGFTQSPSEWFNTSVFSTSEPGTYGDSSKGMLRGPFFEDLDLSFAKLFPISERQNLQFRLEIFNVGSNWHSLNDYYGSNLIPGNSVGGCNFGSLASIGCDPYSVAGHLWNPHVLQMSLVYSF
jgi:hypothetical protein